LFFFFSFFRLVFGIREWKRAALASEIGREGSRRSDCGLHNVEQRFACDVTAQLTGSGVQRARRELRA